MFIGDIVLWFIRDRVVIDVGWRINVYFIFLCWGWIGLDYIYIGWLDGCRFVGFEIVVVVFYFYVFVFFELELNLLNSVILLYILM